MHRRQTEPDSSARARVRGGACALVLLATAWLPAGSAAADESTEVPFALTRGGLDTKNPKDVIAAAQVWCDLFSQHLARNGVGLSFAADFSSHDEVLDGLTTGRIGAAFVSPVEFVAMRDIADIVAVGTIVRTGDDGRIRGALIVRADNQASSIDDLRGAKFAYLGPYSGVGHLFPQARLYERGYGRMKDFFGEVVEYRNEKSALFAVAMGDADVGSVSSHTLELLREMSPGVRRKIKILDVSDPMPVGVIVASRIIDERTGRHFRDYLLDGERQSSPRLQSVLQTLHIGGIRATTRDDFEEVVRLIEITRRHERTQVDPICGRQLSAATARASEPLAGEELHFCSDACRDVYLGHTVRMREPEARRLLVLGLPFERTTDLDPRDLIEGLRQQFEFVTDGLDADLAVELLPSLEATKARLADGTLSLVRLTGPQYVRLEASTKIVPLVRHEMSQPEFKAILVTSHSGGVTRVADLRGRTLAMTTDHGSEIDVYVEQVVNGFGSSDAQQFFGRTLPCPSEASALRAVAFGQAEAAVVTSTTFDTMREMHPGVARQLRLLDASAALRAGPVCAAPGLDKSVAATFRELMLRLHELPKGKALLEVFRIHQLVAAEDVDYDPVRAMLAGLER